MADRSGEKFLSKAIQEHSKGRFLKVEMGVEIQEHHDATKEIEKSLLELHQMFLDMAVMVEAQGEQMDDIKHYVTNAFEYVSDGTKSLKIAKEHKRSSRRLF
ncbi:syntaxin-related KNOLLE [Olea europaea subsp. europaea]|uniref:Syntaxin-related KNOLLE n=1 Tax=Olea europaea subsp. europaea TaxID=158383 RepID=A0A8S0SF33_OLEEU|nr:syntaxin-related KNOLLE [Olea europaea subsp. europaea]